MPNPWVTLCAPLPAKFYWRKKMIAYARQRRPRVITLLSLLPLFITVFALTGHCQQNAIQYVGTHGRDSNDGLSWQTAKATLTAAYVALPSCSSGEGKSWKHCGDIEIGSGTFKVHDGIVIASPFVWIHGRGAAVTILTYTAQQGCAITWTADPLNDGSGDTYVGGLFDLTIQGTGNPAGTAPWPHSFQASPKTNWTANGPSQSACGLETRDIEGFQMRGVEIKNFAASGDACWWDHAVHDWNERFQVRAELADCTVGWRITADSTAFHYPSTTFGYGNFDLWINPTQPGQVGVFESAGLFTYSNIHLIENIGAYATAFALTNSASWRSNLINFHFEGPDCMGFYLDPGTTFRGVGPVDSGEPNSIDGTYSVTPESE